MALLIKVVHWLQYQQTIMLTVNDLVFYSTKVHLKNTLTATIYPFKLSCCNF